MSTEEERNKRLGVISAYLSIFSEAEKKHSGVEITYRQDAMQIVNAIYWRYADELIRKTIDSGIIQNYKIAANTELAIMLADPIESVSEGSSTTDVTNFKKLLTARLAFFTAFSMLIEWNKNIIHRGCKRALNVRRQVANSINHHILFGCRVHFVCHAEFVFKLLGFVDSHNVPIKNKKANPKPEASNSQKISWLSWFTPLSFCS